MTEANDRLRSLLEHEDFLREGRVGAVGVFPDPRMSQDGTPSTK